MDALETSRYKLLELTAISGEFPADQLGRLISSPSYSEKVITGLKTGRLLRTHYRDRLRGYRLTRKAKDLLLKDNPDRFRFYLTGNTETNRVHSEVPRRLRLHQKAEAYLTLYHAGIHIYPDGKPGIFTQEYQADPADVKKLPLFYSSREIKALGPDMTKIKNSRTVGVLLAQQDVYVIYNAGDHILKWEYRTEIRVNALMQHHLKGNPYPGIPNIRAIMMGSGMETAKLLMTSTGGYKKSLFMLDTSYGHFHFIPNTMEGSCMLKIFCSPGIRKRLDGLLLSDMQPKADLPMEHDAVSKNGFPVLLAYDFDMVRISKFNAACNLYEKDGVLICFDFQQTVLSEILSGKVNYSSIDFEKFKRGFFHET